MNTFRYFVQITLILCIVLVSGAFSAENDDVFGKLKRQAVMSEYGVKEISYDEFQELLSSGETFALVNALPSKSFKEGHIPNSINMRVEQVGNKRAGKKIGPYDKNVVVYCANFKCHASTNVAKALMELGYTNVVDYKGGLKEWQDKGNELVTA